VTSNEYLGILPTTKGHGKNNNNKNLKKHMKREKEGKENDKGGRHLGYD
jgi:hypothetical protein